MACCETMIHVGDIGIIFEVHIENCDVAFNLSSATVKRLIFQKPGGTQLTKTAIFYTNGSDGVIQYESVSGDLDESGTWSLQAYIEISAQVYRSEIKRFKVYPNL